MIDFIKKYKFVILTAVLLIAAIVLVFIFSGGEVTVTDNSGSSSQSVQSTAALIAAEKDNLPQNGTSSQITESNTEAISDTKTASPASSDITSAVPKPADTSVSESTTVQSDSKAESKKPPAEAVTNVQTARTQTIITTAKTQPITIKTEPSATAASTPSPIKYDSSCVFRIDCSTILNNMNNLDKNKVSFVPSDGVIYTSSDTGFNSGETVFDILKRVCRENNIQLESSFTPAFNSSYVEGINNLYEFDCGSASGWIYRVNGELPNMGCSLYKVTDGDIVEFLYTCDLGFDIQ